MKSLSVVVGFFFTTMIVGCATSQQPIMLEAVGSNDSLHHESQQNLSQLGTLIVYSDLTNNVNDSDHPLHSEYKIYSTDGRLLLEVRNQSGSFNQDPANVQLSSGRYFLVAQAVNQGMVKVPIVIDARKQTVVDLNQEVLPQISATDSAWVHLPNGYAVGIKTQ